MVARARAARKAALHIELAAERRASEADAGNDLEGGRVVDEDGDSDD
jgi:hypothetical protein